MGRKKKKQEKLKKAYELYFLIISLVFVIPFSYTERLLDPNLAIRMLVLSIIVLVFFVFQLISKKSSDYSFLKLLIFPVFIATIVWTIISIYFSLTPSEGLYELNKLILFVLLIIITSYIVLRYNQFSVVLSRATIILAIISVSFGLYQYFENVPGKSGYQLFMALYEVDGLMGHKNQYSSSLFLMIPFIGFSFFDKKMIWKILGGISLAGVLINIFILQTRAVWVAVVVAMVVFVIGLLLFYSRSSNRIVITKKTIMVIVSIIIMVLISGVFIINKTGALDTLKLKVISIFDSDSHDNQGRLKIWQASGEMIGDNPIIGVGPGNWKIEIVDYYKMNTDVKYQNWRRAHNDYIQIASEKGIFGLILYLLMFAVIFFYTVKLISREELLKAKLIYLLILSSLAGYIIVSFFSFPYERINHQVFIAIMFSIIIGKYYSKFNESDQKFNRIYLRYQPIILIVLLVSVYYSYSIFQSEVNVKIVKGLKQQNRFKEMIEYTDKALSDFYTIDALTTPLHHYKGEANLKMKNNKQAYADFKKAIEYFPGHISSLNNLAIMAYQLGKEDEAFYYLEKTLDVFPKHQDALFNRALAYYKSGDYERAYVAILSCYSKDDRDDKYIMLEKDLERKLNGNAKR